MTWSAQVPDGHGNFFSVQIGGEWSDTDTVSDLCEATRSCLDQQACPYYQKCQEYHTVLVNIQESAE